ncbi:MAG TPA: RNA-binding protein [Candidatus Choladousia intestinigallinarum]|nr:RNA-binding protein [Candidatus Choladousia intestinigallinarum]
MEKDKEVLLFQKRIRELAERAENTGCPQFTDFLNLYEQNILHDTLQNFPWINWKTFGGYEQAERQMAAFLPDALSYDGSEVEYPIACLHIRPKNSRFAETLTHRDILGALMNLGIDRCKTGDIPVLDQEAYLFCHGSLGEMICRELTRIRRTSVVCTVCRETGFTYTPRTKSVTGSISSLRLDALLSVAFQSSRSSLLSLIQEGKVFVNGKLITSNAFIPKEGDLVSVRGMGRFRYLGTGGQTKKGRMVVQAERFI